MKLLVATLLASLLIPQGARAADYLFATEELAPFAFARDGKATGPFVEITTAVCHEIKKRCQFVWLPWRRAAHLAEIGDAQGVFPILDTPERRESFVMTQPLVRSGYALYAREKSGFVYRKPTDIKDRTIGAYGPSGTSSTAQMLITQTGSNGRVVIELANENVLRELAGGRYGDDGLAMINEDVASDLIRTKGITGIEFVGEVKSIAYSIGLSRKGLNGTQQTEFQDAVAKLVANGEVGRILAAYGLRSN